MKEDLLGIERITNSTTRPHFGPTQVRSLEEIKPGKLLIARRTVKRGRETVEQEPSELRVVGSPFVIHNSLWVNIEYTGSGFTARISLADYGVVSYNGDNGITLWNRSNWLEDPDKIPTPAG